MARQPEGKRLVASSRVKFAIAIILNRVCTKDGGAALYADGWDDSRVAAEAARETGEAVSTHSVSLIRGENFGGLRRPAEVDPVAALEKRVAALEEKVSEALDLVDRRFDTLEGAVIGPSDLFTGKEGAHVNGRT